MIKKIALLLALTIVTAYTTNISIAAPAKTPAKAAAKQRSVSVNPVVYGAISKYKQHNYTGVIQDLTPYLAEDGDKYNDKNNTIKNSSIAHYYLGLSYTQLGMKDKAKAEYDKVLEINDDAKLVNYSRRAVACINGQPQCAANYVDKNAPADDDMTVFIKSNKPLHDDVVEQIQKKALDKQMDRINNDMAPDMQNYKLLNDASKVNQVQPTDSEIANAVRVLAHVGFNPFNMMNGYTDPQMAALSAALGNSNNNNNMNYLPYLMSQGANPEVAKQMMQSMMMSQMMPDMGSFGKF